MIKYLIYFFRKKFLLADVFTPSSSATVTYVSREKPEKEFQESLLTPGYQIILYGFSGTGKTTMIRNILLNNGFDFEKVACESGSSVQSVLLSAFDELGEFYRSSMTLSKSSKASSEIKSSAKSYFEFSTSLKTELTNSEGSDFKRIIDVQLTPQRLAHMYGKAKKILVIEDFHKVQSEDKQRLSNILKIFMDSANDYPKTKIIAVGAVGTPRELIRLDRELDKRRAEIEVPLMNTTELENIIYKGEEALNIKFDLEVINRLVKLSVGLAAIIHHLCLGMCRNKNVEKTMIRKVYFNNSDLD